MHTCNLYINLINIKYMDIMHISKANTFLHDNLYELDYNFLKF